MSQKRPKNVEESFNFKLIQTISKIREWRSRVSSHFKGTFGPWTIHA